MYFLHLITALKVTFIVLHLQSYVQFYLRTWPGRTKVFSRPSTNLDTPVHEIPLVKTGLVDNDRLVLKERRCVIPFMQQYCLVETLLNASAILINAVKMV